MDIFDCKDDTSNNDDWILKKVNKFKYLGVIFIMNND